MRAARQNVTTDCFYRTDMIKSVRLARSKSLATHTSFTDYAGNDKHILKIMEDTENKRVLKKYPDFHPDCLTTFGGSSLTLQVSGQVKKRRNTNNNNMITGIFLATEIPLE